MQTCKKDVSVRLICHSADGLHVKAPLFLSSPPSQESALLNQNRGLELKSEAAPISWRINRGGKQCLDRSPSPTNTVHTNPCTLQLSSLLLNSPSSFFLTFYSPVMFYECSVRPKSKRNLLSFCDNVTNQREEQLTSNRIENTSQTYYLIGNVKILSVL